MTLLTVVLLPNKVYVMYLYQEIGSCLREIFAKAVFMHHPIGSLSTGRPSTIKHKGFPESLDRSLAENFAIFSSGFPVAWCCSSVSPWSIWVLLVSWTEEKPLHISFGKKWLVYREKNFRLVNKNNPENSTTPITVRINKETKVPKRRQICGTKDLSFVFCATLQLSLIHIWRCRRRG